MQGNSKKNIIIIVVILVAVVIAGYMYSTRDQGSDQLLTSVPTADTATVDSDLLSALHELQQLKLDDSIFNDPVWKSLADFSHTLAPQPAGRPNPFAPLEGTLSATTTAFR